MKVYVDADSCPVRIREIIAAAARRRKVETFFVAARPLPVKPSAWVSLVEVEPGQDAADRWIVDAAEPLDLVITRDIPLAAELVGRGINVINDRGDHYTRENIGPRLSERNFMAELRSMGLESMKTGGFSNREINAFAATFDRELTRTLNQSDSFPQK